jgi:energy-coupling factor transport system ATP-binding protein
VVDHDAAPWLPIVDRVVELVGGGLVEHGPGWRPADRTSGLRLPPASAGAVLLTADAAGFTYRGTRVPALPPTSALVTGGRTLAVTGPNGTGKSTLALLLAGLRAPTTGRVEAAAELADGARKGVREPHRWRAEELVTRIGTVFQNPEQQFLTGRLRDELALGPLRSGEHAAAARATADELLERLGLTPFADANPYTLSGGQQRRLSVATALATSPRVLVLDEPTFGQDAATWREVVTLLAEQRARGCAVAVVTHDRDLVEVLADERLAL